jgi:hypothetical protein
MLATTTRSAKEPQPGSGLYAPMRRRPTKRQSALTSAPRLIDSARPGVAEQRHQAQVEELRQHQDADRDLYRRADVCRA